MESRAKREAELVDALCRGDEYSAERTRSLIRSEMESADSYSPDRQYLLRLTVLQLRGLIERESSEDLKRSLEAECAKIEEEIGQIPRKAASERKLEKFLARLEKSKNEDVRKLEESITHSGTAVRMLIVYVLIVGVLFGLEEFLERKELIRRSFAAFFGLGLFGLAFLWNYLCFIHPAKRRLASMDLTRESLEKVSRRFSKRRISRYDRWIVRALFVFVIGLYAYALIAETPKAWA